MRVTYNTQLGNPFLMIAAQLFSGAQKSGGASSDVFLAAQQQQEAAELASQRSRRWATWGGIALGVGGLAALAYFLRRS